MRTENRWVYLVWDRKVLGLKMLPARKKSEWTRNRIAGLHHPGEPVYTHPRLRRQVRMAETGTAEYWKNAGYWNNYE